MKPQPDLCVFKMIWIGFPCLWTVSSRKLILSVGFNVEYTNTLEKSSFLFNPCVVFIFLLLSQVFVGLVDPLHFGVFNSTQLKKIMLKYSTDVYFIPITSNINSKYGWYLAFTFVRSHLWIKVLQPCAETAGAEAQNSHLHSHSYILSLSHIQAHTHT